MDEADLLPALPGHQGWQESRACGRCGASDEAGDVIVHAEYSDVHERSSFAALPAELSEIVGCQVTLPWRLHRG